MWAHLERTAKSALLVFLLAAAASARAASLDHGPADHPVEMGHFYSQTGAGFGTGFEVLDERRLGIRTEYFWSEFDRLGGVSTFGYPTSTAFRWASLNWGQLTQRSLIYWDRFEGRLRLANLYEILEAAGLDDFLESKGVPRPIADDGATTHEEAIEIRLGWLENETLRDAYFANPNPGLIPNWSRGDAIDLRGLPMSKPERMGPFIAQRFQRAVMQLWVEDVPGGEPPGAVTFVNGGDIFKQAGLLPRADSAQPHSPSNLPFASESEFRLVFSSQRTGSTQIYSSASNGANAVALTSTDNVERFPAVSPDGAMLAFARGEFAPPVDQRREPSAGELTLPRIVVRDLSTGDERTISPEGVWAGSLSWSPDGTKIVYSGWADFDTELYVADVASAENGKLLTLPYSQITPDWSPDGATIIFASDHEGPYQLFSVSPDGAGLTRITHSGVSEFSPAWSPSGESIVFSRSSEFGHDVFVANPDGSSAQNLTRRRGHDHSPSFTPDGRFVVFVSERAFNEDIYVVPIDGSVAAMLVSGDGADRDPSIARFAAPAGSVQPVPEEATLLFYSSSISEGPTDIWAASHGRQPMAPVNLTMSRWIDVLPGWSPDGRHIAFTGSRDGTLDLFIARSDGSGVGQLTNSGQFNGFASFSPDSSRLLFSSDRFGANNVFAVNVNGTGLVRITQSVGADVDAVWTSGGREIVFASDRDGDFDIYRMSLTDRRAVQLTNFPGNARNPDVSPDGQTIIFAVHSGRFEGLYSMRADGSGITPLIRDGWEYRNPAWSPDGRLIAFASRRSAEGTYGIYILDPRGQFFWNVADTPSNDLRPVWRQGIATGF